MDSPLYSPRPHHTPPFEKSLQSQINWCEWANSDVFKLQTFGLINSRHSSGLHWHMQSLVREKKSLSCIFPLIWIYSPTFPQYLCRAFYKLPLATLLKDEMYWCTLSGGAVDSKSTDTAPVNMCLHWISQLNMLRSRDCCFSTPAGKVCGPWARGRAKSCREATVFLAFADSMRSTKWWWPISKTKCKSN